LKLIGVLNGRMIGNPVAGRCVSTKRSHGECECTSVMYYDILLYSLDISEAFSIK
jgi:hypothetical protein